MWYSLASLDRACGNLDNTAQKEALEVWGYSTFHRITTPRKERMKTTPDIIILHNDVKEDSPEDVLDILVQAKWIAEILIEKGYTARLLPFSFENISQLAKENPSLPPIVFNLVDSAPGEETLSYLIPGILSHFHLPFTGCSLDALFVTTNKMLAKRLMHASGIPTPCWICLDASTASLPLVQDAWYLVKPIAEDASVGLDDDSLVHGTSLEVIEAAIRRKEQRSVCRYFAEQFVDGREFTACMYGHAADSIILPPYEWVFEGFEEQQRAKIITYDAKWNDKSFGFEHIKAKYEIAPVDVPLVARLELIARQCWQVFGLSGYARVDFRVDPEGNPWVLEVNGNPSFYGFYHIANNLGLPFPSIVEHITLAAHDR
ncbi:MAG: D-alanine--D-alanine ligase [Spirochaetae bacterium HGW-Spirochaetae-8]|nr:MAG: D-alanine--D-alanine ligase [Spirochaetae bacterium HGW-Spirochaetae-8]